MTVNKFIRKLLKLKELVVCGYELNERKRQLLIFVKPYKNGCPPTTPNTAMSVSQRYSKGIMPALLRDAPHAVELPAIIAQQ